MAERRNISISLRLTVWFGTIFLAGWVMFGAAMWLALKTTLAGERRQTLARRVDRMQELLRSDRGKSLQDQQDDLKDFASATGNGLVEVRRLDGTHLWPALSSASQAFRWPDASRVSDQRFVHVTSAGQPYWTIERPGTLDGQAVVLLAAAPESGNLLVLNSFLHTLLAVAPMLVIVSMVGGYWTSRRALRPVDRLTAAVNAIGIRNLSERLPVRRSGDELQRLAETCNDMLERLEVAVRKLKQLTADASHELRGPLSLIRTIAEVALRSPSADNASRQALNEVVEEAAHAAALLEQMLELARIDAEPLDVEIVPVSLATLLDESCSAARLIAQEKQIALIQARMPAYDTTILGDPSSLSRLMWILLDNAIKYTPAGGRVEVSLDSGPLFVTLTVRDTGIGIASADVPRIFDRFYRADPSRSQVEGNGLGLAIAKWIVEMHGAEIRVTSREGHGAQFEISFSRHREIVESRSTHPAPLFSTTRV